MGSTVCAQTGTSVPAYPIVNPPMRSPSDVQSSWRGGANVIAWWLNGFGQQQTRDGIRRAVEKTINAQKPFLEWTGQGVLLNARVITRVDPNTPLRAWAVLGDGATVVGSGKTAEEALLTAWRKDTLNAGVPDGWSLDQTMSTYLWVRLKSDGTISTEGVPRGTMYDLDKRVRDNWAQMEVRRFENELGNLEAWNQVAKTAKARLADRQSRKTIDDALQAIVDSQARVREINEKLKAALDKARAAQETVQLIATLQGVVSVAQLTQMAIDGLNVPATEFDGQSTGAGVARKVESLRDGRVQYAAEMKVAFDGSIGDLQKFLDKLLGQIAPANPPAGVRDSLQVTKP